MSEPIPDPDSPFASFAEPKKRPPEPAAPATPDPNSPFASFAQPKPSALKQFVERQQQATQSKKAHWQYLGVAYGATVFAASVAVAIGVGFKFVLLAIAFAAGGALLGVPAGWLLGAVSWGLTRGRMMGGMGGLGGAALAVSQVAASQGGGAGPLAHSGIGQSNQWNKLQIWLTVWAVLGMVIGAGWGAGLATEPGNRDAMEAAIGWGMAGACLGLVAATVGWLALRRKASQAA